MPTATDRLEARLQLTSCKVCQWLAGLEEKLAKEWRSALSNAKYSNPLIAEEARIDGATFSEDSVKRHRRARHR